MYECAGANKGGVVFRGPQLHTQAYRCIRPWLVACRPIHGQAEALTRYCKNLLFGNRVRGVLSLHGYRTIGLTFACGRSAL